jgi:hypothetical protein
MHLIGELGNLNPSNRHYCESSNRLHHAGDAAQETRSRATDRDERDREPWQAQIQSGSR